MRNLYMYWSDVQRCSFKLYWTAFWPICRTSSAEWRKEVQYIILTSSMPIAVVSSLSFSASSSGKSGTTNPTVHSMVYKVTTFGRKLDHGAEGSGKQKAQHGFWLSDLGNIQLIYLKLQLLWWPSRNFFDLASKWGYSTWTVLLVPWYLVPPTVVNNSNVRFNEQGKLTDPVCGTEAFLWNHLERI